MKLLGEIVKQISGVTYQKAQASIKPVDGYKAVLRAGNIYASRILEEDYVYVPENLIRNDRLLKYGDILIAASSGSLSIVGKAAMIETDIDAGFGAFCRVLRPRTEIVYPRYLKFFFETNYYKNTIKHLAEGANINNLKSEHFDNLEILLPPLDEQKKIAAILDAADSLRQKDQQLVERYTALSQSLFLEMFGDPVTNPMGWRKDKLGDLTDLITDGKHGDCENETSSGYFFISAKDINNQIIDYSNARQISKNDFDEVHRRTNLCEGDLVMVNTGATIGKIAVATDIARTKKTTFQKSVAVIKPKKSLLSTIFLKYLFLLRIDAFASKGSGSAVKNLLLSEMRRFEIILPELNYQNQFAERIQLIEAQKQQAQRSLEKSEALFNSLLQRAFAGELTAKMTA